MSYLKAILRDKNTIKIFCLLITFLGVCLAIIQYFLNRSLWFDEAALAIHFLEKDFSQLFTLVSTNQAAPIGFLMVEKFFGTVLGNNEMALRLFPLCCYLLSIPFVFGFAIKLFPTKNVAFLSTAIFSITNSVLRYSSEVSQYSTDVFISAALIYVALTFTFQQKRDYYFLALIGAVVIWFSNVSIVLLFVIGLYILYAESVKKNYLPILSIIPWLLSFSIYCFLFVGNKTFVAFSESLFMPLNPFTVEFLNFWRLGLQSIYGGLIGFGPVWLLPFGLSLVGLFRIIEMRKYVAMYFLLFPILVHLGLASLKLYPFSSQLILYQVPMMILLLVSGSEAVIDFARKKFKSVPKYSRLAPIGLFFVPLFINYPNRKEETKESLQFMEAFIQKEDNIYVYNPASVAYRFYTRSGKFSFDNKVIVGNTFRDDEVEYVNEIKSLKGRTWLLFAHVFPLDQKINEETFMVNTLKNSGNEFLLSYKTKGSSAYLVDIK
jgi:hypothetical protein